MHLNAHAQTKDHSRAIKIVRALYALYTERPDEKAVWRMRNRKPLFPVKKEINVVVHGVDGHHEVIFLSIV